MMMTIGLSHSIIHHMAMCGEYLQDSTDQWWVGLSLPGTGAKAESEPGYVISGDSSIQARLHCAAERPTMHPTMLNNYDLEAASE